jgi:hypothetical protein
MPFFSNRHIRKRTQVERADVYMIVARSGFVPLLSLVALSAVCFELQPFHMNDSVVPGVVVPGVLAGAFLVSECMCLTAMFTSGKVSLHT